MLHFKTRISLPSCKTDDVREKGKKKSDLTGVYVQTTVFYKGLASLWKV